MLKEPLCKISWNPYREHLNCAPRVTGFLNIKAHAISHVYHHVLLYSTELGTYSSLRRVCFHVRSNTHWFRGIGGAAGREVFLLPCLHCLECWQILSARTASETSAPNSSWKRWPILCDPHHRAVCPPLEAMQHVHNNIIFEAYKPILWPKKAQFSTLLYQNTKFVYCLKDMCIFIF